MNKEKVYWFYKELNSTISLYEINRRLSVTDPRKHAYDESSSILVGNFSKVHDVVEEVIDDFDVPRSAFYSFKSPIDIVNLAFSMDVQRLIEILL